MNDQTQAAARRPQGGMSLKPLGTRARSFAVNEGHLTDAERKRILRGVAEAQAAFDLSDTKLAAIVGVSRGLYSRLKKGLYSGNADKYLRIIRMWLDGRAEKVDTPEAEYVATSIGEEILMVCDIAVEQPCIGIVKTPSGVGKTSALREMARRLGPARCAYLAAGEALAFRRELLFEVAGAIGVTTSGTVSKLYSKIRSRMAGYYSGGKGESYLLIIDEATTLRPSAINMLRNLHDEPACRTAIVLADTINRMDSFLYASRREGIAGGNEQLRSRSKAQFVFPVEREILPADVKLIADVTLRSLGFKGRLPVRSYQYLAQIAAGPGTFRNVTARLANVHYIATKQNVVADYSVAQLDFAGQLSGEQCRMEHAEIPFRKTA